MITNELISEIKSKINDNHKQAITGDILQGVLVDMVKSLCEVYPQTYTDEEKAQARANIDALSNHNGEITKEKLSLEVQAILNDVANKQNITDESLATIAKTIVGAINEVYKGGLKDASITTSKIEDGAITEPKLDTALVNVINSAVQPADLASAIATALASYVAKSDIVDITGSATDKVMSQHGVTETINGVNDKVTELEQKTTDIKENIEPVSVTIHTVNGINGYWYATTGTWVSDNTRRGTEKIDVLEGEKYLITTNIGGSVVIGYLVQWSGDTYVGVSNDFKGGSGNAVDREYIVPNGVTKIAICSYNTTSPSLKKVTSSQVFKAYSKQESDERYAPISSQEIKRYGVKWSITDAEDLGKRCFDAVGMTAQIGIGPTNGQSDFDSVFPWSEMKRCNIKINANGAKIVTFEGETGFALDGSNGNVFVRIPKFYSERYTENGEEYIVISSIGNTVHPAFVEDGKELNEIFVAAFEGRIVDGKLSSRSGVIPSNNETGKTFLDAAKANGNQYTLYDMRAVDALWRLMAVEYGCRNSNQILGWGYSDYQQPVDNPAYRVSVSATNTNTVTLGLPIDNIERLRSLARFTPGATITICKGSQFVIVAQRVVTAVSQPTVNDNLVITFDGAGVDVTTDMWVGSAPCVTNRCETIDSAYRLAWHTGRASFNPKDSLINPATLNPCRYRWIENIVGSCWHILPDISFDGGQMYVCQNMRDYDMFKITAPYYPVGDVLPINSDNGIKEDIANVNYWVTNLMNDVFARGINFGTTYNKALTSTKAFGAYYYLYNTRVAIVNGGGFDHLWRSNILTNRAWFNASDKWYLYGGRLMFKNID